MTISFEFLQRDAALRDRPKTFCDALIASGRFYRDDRAVIHFKIADGDFVRVDRKETLREILLTGGVITLTGDVDDDSATGTLWLWFASRRWTFPRDSTLTSKAAARGRSVEAEYSRMARR